MEGSFDFTTCNSLLIQSKAFLVPTEPLESELNPILLLDSLRDRRKHYRELLLEKMRAPDGSYEEGFTVPGSSPLPAKQQSEKADLNTNNPLSLHVEVNCCVSFLSSKQIKL